MSPDTKRVGDILQDMGRSWADLAKELGVKSQHTTNWKSRGIPRPHLRGIAEYINMPIEFIINEDWESNETAMRIGNKIKNRRSELKLSQNQLCELLDWDQARISHYECDRR